MNAFPKGRWTGHYAGMWHSDEPPEFSDPEDERSMPATPGPRCACCGVPTVTPWWGFVTHHTVRCAAAMVAAVRIAEALKAVSR